MVIPGTVEEIYPDELSPWEVTQHLALLKAEDVFAQNPDALVLAADTIVVLNDKILGKPDDEEHAFQMLMQLSGKSHTVITGVAIICQNSKDTTDNSGVYSKVFHVSTKVSFAHLTDGEILSYIATGSPLDKAGAYGIQDDLGSLFITSIEGDYYNVVGLPIQKLYSVFKNELPEVSNMLLKNTLNQVPF